jgi:LysR family transcriptional regulator (chromosome initiation inhibitor)
MPVPLEFARTLAVVVAEGTIEAAARALHLTPSAVSQRIRTLEEQVGRVLLVRGKPMRPTDAGVAIVRLGRQIDLLEREALGEMGAGSDAAAQDQPRPTSMPLAVNADSLATWLLAALARAARHYPVVFDLHRDDQDFTAALLETGTVMAAVTSQAKPVSGCLVRPLGVMRYEPFATPQFVARWFAVRDDADAFGRAPVVYFDRHDDLQARFIRSRGADDALAPRHYVPSSADFAAAVAMGLGWGLLPLEQAAPLLADGRIVRLTGDAIGVALYWQQWNLRSALLTSVAEQVASAAREALA